MLVIKHSSIIRYNGVKKILVQISVSSCALIGPIKQSPSQSIDNPRQTDSYNVLDYLIRQSHYFLPLSRRGRKQEKRFVYFTRKAKRIKGFCVAEHNRRTTGDYHIDSPSAATTTSSTIPRSSWPRRKSSFISEAKWRGFARATTRIVGRLHNFLSSPFSTLLLLASSGFFRSIFFLPSSLENYSSALWVSMAIRSSTF